MHFTTTWFLRVKRSLQEKIPTLTLISQVLMFTGAQTIIIYQDYCLAYSNYKTPLIACCIPTSEILKGKENKCASQNWWISGNWGTEGLSDSPKITWWSGASEWVFLATILKAITYSTPTRTGNLLDILHTISHLIFKTTFWGWYHLNSDFTKEETEERLVIRAKNYTRFV